MIKIKKLGSLTEVNLRLNCWAKIFNLKNFFIQIVPIKDGDFLIFYDSRLDELE